MISFKELTGKKPPEDIIDKDKLKLSNTLKSKKYNKIKMKKVKDIYNIKIFKNCFFISNKFIEIKDVKKFFNLISKDSNNKINEKRKYRPPSHWEVDLHKINVSSKDLILLNIVNPVPVKPEIASKKQSRNDKL